MPWITEANADYGFYEFLTNVRMLCLAGAGGDRNVLSVPLEPMRLDNEWLWRPPVIDDRSRVIREAVGVVRLSRLPVNWEDDRQFEALLKEVEPPLSEGCIRRFGNFKTSPDGLRIDWALMDEEIIRPVGEVA